MEPCFVRSKFNAMLGVATVTMAVNFIVSLTGSLVVGNIVGAEGLAGFNVCSPVFAVASFFAALLSVGSGLVFSQAMGAFDERKASGVWSQTACLAAGVGVLTGIVMLAGGSLYMDFNGVTGEILRQAQSYWKWQALQLTLSPMVLLVMAMIYADGDSLVATLAGGVYVGGTVLFSIFFTWLFGTAGGAACGTSVAMLCVLAVASTHFLRQNNHLKFIRYFSWKDLGATIANSAPDATIYLCWGLLILVVNRYTVASLGRQDMLAVVALGASIVQFSIVFDGVGEAIIPLGGMYAGEGNWPALRKLANHSAVMATFEGLVCGVVMFACASWICPIYGFRGDNAALLPDAVRTMRTLALAMPFMGFLMMANTHYLVVKHVPLAVSVTVMKDFVLPCVMMFPCAAIWGFEGCWIGFAIGYVLAAAYPFVFVLVRYGRKSFPWLVPAERNRILDFSVRLDSDSALKARDRIGEFLRGRNIEPRVVNRVMLAIEETALATLERNKKGPVLVEYAVFLNKKGFVRLVTRDTGTAFDVNGVTAVLSAFAERRYLNTLNSNRSEYFFKTDVAVEP